MKKRIITLGGMPGSGKSTTGRSLASQLGYARYSSGDFFREMAAARGISLEEMNREAERDTGIDAAIDEWVRQKGALDRIIIDSRMAFHWIPEGYNVFLALDPRTAAQRTFADAQGGLRTGQEAGTFDETYRNLLSRIESEKARYASLYGVDYTDASCYDRSVDTGSSGIEEVTAAILAGYEAWLAA
ncbi:MAG TPA: AAA family ATPase [Candidatus Paceibacterota bacterium]|nr:AAA family ATPase [Candidatus Paceibacterota bacterium]